MDFPAEGLPTKPTVYVHTPLAEAGNRAASLAIRGDGKHMVHLDVAIETMRQTGEDMNAKYKETALGGLAVNVPNC